MSESLAVAIRILPFFIFTFIAVAARAAAPQDVPFYERFDPKSHSADRCTEFNTPERLATVPKLAERFPDYIRSHANELFFRAAAHSQVSVCLWLADHGLDLTQQPPPMLALLGRPELLPVVRRLLDLGTSPDVEIRVGSFNGPLHEYAFTIRVLDALDAMERLNVHKPVLVRDVVRRDNGQPRRLAGNYAAGTEMATRGISLSPDGYFAAFGIGAEAEGLWRSDGKTVELFGFHSDPAKPLTTPTLILRVSPRGLVYDGTTFTKGG